MKAKLVIVLGFLVAAGVLVFLGIRKKGGDGEAPPGGTTTTPKTPADAVEITFLYSTEKKDWIEAATVEFGKVHPEVKVNLVGKGSIDAAQDILDEKVKPTLWSPADGVILKMAADDWETKTKKPLFAREGEDAPQPLVVTPVVFAIWENRADVLMKASGGKVTWKAIHKAVTSNRGWPAIGGPEEWGFVKLGHTNPTRSNSGLMALLLMTFEFYGKRAGVEVGDVLKPDYQTFVAEIERGVTKFETSTGTFMIDMIRFGPSKYDIAVVYENLAIEQLENAQGRWGNLKVYYPDPTLWSDHPAGLLAADWSTEPQRKAARLYLAFLRAKPQQELALSYGFRPADPSVAVKTTDPRNPWNRLAPYGISVDVPTAATVPEGPVVRNLMMMWSRVVGGR
ncbi:MAG TPA: substrate-binding domain-containing protein [Haliangiales bacterium]|nr:substrate-binding domain-containing protein [Haliangiales bacterium]